MQRPWQKSRQHATPPCLHYQQAVPAPDQAAPTRTRSLPGLSNEDDIPHSERLLFRSTAPTEPNRTICGAAVERKEKAHLLPPSVLSRRSMLLLRFVVKKKKSEKCEITKHFHHPFLEVLSSLAQLTSWDGSSSRGNSSLMKSARSATGIAAPLHKLP